MRLDKFLKMSRIIKRRSVANEIADNRKSSSKRKNCKAKLWSKNRRYNRNTIWRQNIKIWNNNNPKSRNKKHIRNNKINIKNLEAMQNAWLLGLFNKNIDKT